MLDPIDGTVNFLHGFLCAVSLASTRMQMLRSD